MRDGDEDSLTEALKRGERSAFQRFFRRVQGRSLRVARRILASQEDAEDAVQEAVVSFYRRVRGFRGESSVDTWFYRILVNACLKLRDERARRAGTVPLDRVPAPVASPETDEAARVLDREIQKLPLQQRLVFTLLEVEGCSSAEVREILHLKAGTVRYHLHQARQVLRTRLARYFEGRTGKRSRV